MSEVGGNQQDFRTGVKPFSSSFELLTNSPRVQGAGHELRCLAIRQSGAFCTEIRTFLSLFLVVDSRLATIKPPLRNEFTSSFEGTAGA